MKGEFTKTSKEFELMGDFYKLVRDNYIVENTDEYFKGLLDGVGEFFKKYEVNSATREEYCRVSALAQKLGQALVDYADATKEVHR